MRNIAEIRRDLAAKSAELKALDGKDIEAVKNATDNVKSLLKELEGAEVAERAAQALADKEFAEAEKKAGRSFSFVKLLREASDRNGGLTGLEAEIAEMGKKEFQRLGLSSRNGVIIPSCALRAATANGKADVVADSTATYVEGLRERLVIAQLGAHVLGDLTGNVPVISSKAMKGGWGEEAEKSTAKKMDFGKAVLTPHRNFVEGAVTGDLLRQTSGDVEAMLRDSILTAHAELIDSAAIAGTGSAGQPTGILSTAGIGDIALGGNGGAITWKAVVELEGSINANNANRGKLGYLTNAKVNAAMKITEKATGSGRFILDGGKIVNGYPMEWTNLVPSNLSKGSASSKCSALIFGNFDDLYVGHWGGIELVVDPYTLASNGEVRYVLNSWDDCKVVEPKSFAAVKDILA